MAKLSKEVLAEGRKCVQDQDLASFCRWQKIHVPVWGSTNPTEYFFGQNDLELALTLFDRVYSDIDPIELQAEHITAWIRFGFRVLFLVLVVAGTIGGIAYLLQ